MSLNVSAIIDALGTVLLDKQQHVKLALSCILAGGHLLIEDLPGMGKTTLAKGLAQVLGLDYKRVQFTSDLLPADVLGGSVFDAHTQTFNFHSGPIFTQVLLADEINRSTPKTQSALLESMEEYQVSIDGETRALPEPFVVIATQNPMSQAGTYPLPESQLDRFLMSLSLGFPSARAERVLLKEGLNKQSTKGLEQLSNATLLLEARKQVSNVNTSEQLIDYLQRLAQFTRNDDRFSFGLSPRGSLALLNASKAWAFIEGRDFVMPEDVQIVLPYVVEHRVRSLGLGGSVPTEKNQSVLSDYLLEHVEVLEH